MPVAFFLFVGIFPGNSRRLGIFCLGNSAITAWLASVPDEPISSAATQTSSESSPLQATPPLGRRMLQNDGMHFPAQIGNITDEAAFIPWTAGDLREESALTVAVSVYQ
jgi:hypothetical protein